MQIIDNINRNTAVNCAYRSYLRSAGLICAKHFYERKELIELLHKMLTELLRKEMIPALGCTGPTAYALATACCRPYLTAKPKEVKVRVSPAFLKIGFGVATPGTTSPGIEIAAAAGLIAGDYTLGLQVLKPVTQADMEAAAALVKEGIIQVLCAWDQTGVYVRAEVTTENEEVLAVVEHTHDGISLIQVNGEKKL